MLSNRLMPETRTFNRVSRWKDPSPECMYLFNQTKRLNFKQLTKLECILKCNATVIDKALGVTLFCDNTITFSSHPCCIYMVYTDVHNPFVQLYYH